MTPVRAWVSIQKHSALRGPLTAEPMCVLADLRPLLAIEPGCGKGLSTQSLLRNTSEYARLIARLGQGRPAEGQWGLGKAGP